MSKHVPPPTGTPIAAPVEKPQEALYVNTPITPEEAFHAIGRLRKDARDEIYRLIWFLDKTDDYVSRELEHDEGNDEPGATTNRPLDRLTEWRTNPRLGGPWASFAAVTTWSRTTPTQNHP
jgi:hypothetical protein